MKEKFLKFFRWGKSFEVSERERDQSKKAEITSSTAQIISQEGIDSNSPSALEFLASHIDAEDSSRELPLLRKGVSIDTGKSGEWKIYEFAKGQWVTAVQDNNDELVMLSWADFKTKNLHLL